MGRRTRAVVSPTFAFLGWLRDDPPGAEAIVRPRVILFSMMVFCAIIFQNSGDPKLTAESGDAVWSRSSNARISSRSIGEMLVSGGDPDSRRARWTDFKPPLVRLLSTRERPTDKSFEDGWHFRLNLQPALITSRGGQRVRMAYHSQ
jgi:hypothetical protein